MNSFGKIGFKKLNAIFKESNIGNSEKGFRKLNRKITKRLLRYIRRQKRCLVVIAVIFITFSFLQTRPPFLKAKNDIDFISANSAKELIEESAIGLNQNMGGPINFEGGLISAAQANVDFSSDDALENQDTALMQNSSMVSLSNPSGNDVFAGLRREVITYTVQDGDTPFDIAIKFNINTDTVLTANNLKESSIIRPGDKLLILPINGVRVKVGSKDTVAGLAKKYSGKAEEIISFNYLSAGGALITGSYIIIPNGEMPAPAPTKVSAPKYAQNTANSGGSGLMIPTTGYNWSRVHGQNGVDIANLCGTPIYAAAGGKIIIADGVGWNWGYGKYIQIQHAGGIGTLYGHLSRILVEQDETVQKGQLIGLMGTTGRSTGCHLHFEVHGARNPLRK